MTVLCFSPLDSFSGPALVEDEFELDLLDPASSHFSNNITEVAPPRPSKRAKKGHTTNTGMEPKIVNKFPTSNFFDLLAKDGEVEAPHTSNTSSSSPSATSSTNTKPSSSSKSKKPPPIYVHGKFHD